MSELTAVVARVSSVIEAEIVLGLLESNGIEATVSSDDAGGQEPQLQLTQGVRVLVAPEDEQRASELIEEVEAENA